MRTLCLAILLAFMCEAAAAVADPAGEWLVKDGNARIRIEPCANGLWGFISWVQEPGIDRKNPDPAKRNRPIVGVPILRSMMPVKPNRWEGEVYNAESGKMYSASITLVSEDLLKIEGCVLGGLFCGGETWTRVQQIEQKPPAAKPKESQSGPRAKPKDTTATAPEKTCYDG